MRNVKIKRKKPESTVQVSLDQLIDLLIETRKTAWELGHTVGDLKLQVGDLQKALHLEIQQSKDRDNYIAAFVSNQEELNLRNKKKLELLYGDVQVINKAILDGDIMLNDESVKKK